MRRERGTVVRLVGSVLGVATLVVPVAASDGAWKKAEIGPPAVEARDGIHIERRHWEWSLGNQRVVEIRNPYGDLRVRYGGETKKAQLFAVVQQITPGAPDLVVDAHVEGDRRRIAVATNGGDLPPGAKDRADLVLFLPAGAELDAGTDAGLVEVAGVDGRAKVRTTSGAIEVRKVRGALDVATESGAVSVVPDPLGGAVDVATTTGDVSVALRDDAGVVVNVATSGDITTDFSITIAPSPRSEPDKHAVARIGSGNRPIRIESRRGRIRLARRPPSNRSYEELEEE